jgi:hypothetical protein
MTGQEFREAELVKILLDDRARFHADYRRIAGLDPECSLLHLCDRDMLREILQKEFAAAHFYEIEKDVSAGC